MLPSSSKWSCWSSNNGTADRDIESPKNQGLEYSGFQVVYEWLEC